MKKIILIAVCALLVSCNLCGMRISHENEVSAVSMMPFLLNQT